MPNNNQITLGQVLEMAPGDKNSPAYINGEFDGLISNIEQKTVQSTGKPYWKMTVSDPDAPDIRLDVTMFTNPAKFTNRLCHFSGNGMTRKEYNGTPELGIGKNTIIQILSTTQPAPVQQQRTQTRQAAPQPQRAATPAPRQQSAPAANAAPMVIDGQTIGMALKLAGDFMISHGLPLDSQTLHEYASDIIRVSAALKKGKIAPKPSERMKHLDPLSDPNDMGATDETVQVDAPVNVDQEPPQPTRHNPPGPDGSAFPTTENDEDVPF